MSIELAHFEPTDRALRGVARALNPCVKHSPLTGDLVYGAHSDSCVMAAEITERDLARRTSATSLP